MDKIAYMLVVASALTLATYFIHYRLLHFMQPFRDRMFALGEELLDESKLSNDTKEGVGVALRASTSALTVPVSILLLIIVSFVAFLPSGRAWLRECDDTPSDKRIAEKLSLFRRQHFLSILAANWLLAPLLLTQIAFIILLLVIGGVTTDALGRLMRAALMGGSSPLLHFTIPSGR